MTAEVKDYHIALKYRQLLRHNWVTGRSQDLRRRFLWELLPSDAKRRPCIVPFFCIYREI